jgi:hypothetical protein
VLRVGFESDLVVVWAKEFETVVCFRLRSAFKNFNRKFRFLLETDVE